MDRKSGVDNEKVKGGKRLIFPELHSRLSSFRESARNRERKRKRGRERKRERHGDPSSDTAKVF